MATINVDDNIIEENVQDLPETVEEPETPAKSNTVDIEALMSRLRILKSERDNIVLAIRTSRDIGGESIENIENDFNAILSINPSIEQCIVASARLAILFESAGRNMRAAELALSGIKNSVREEGSRARAKVLQQLISNKILRALPSSMINELVNDEMIESVQLLEYMEQEVRFWKSMIDSLRSISISLQNTSMSAMSQRKHSPSYTQVGDTDTRGYGNVS